MTQAKTAPTSATPAKTTTKARAKSKYKFNRVWSLKKDLPAKGVDQHNSTAFGTFICGGGSTMGYKLAGFKHLGGVEIDPKIAVIYEHNHKPAHLYTEDLRIFNQRDDLPAELYDLDLLDQSPPCSSFSISGNRSKDWGKNKKFAEGQAHQRLDDLVFESLVTIKKLKPKIGIIENVHGMVIGKAKPYAKKVLEDFKALGYNVQLFVLNAASMGVPQSRVRVFFIGSRIDLGLPKLKLEFNEKPIIFNDIKDKDGLKHKPLTPIELRYWKAAKMGGPVGKFDANRKERLYVPLRTIGAGVMLYHPYEPRLLSKAEHLRGSTFPTDYNFLDSSYKFLIGMSVPPIMTAQIAHQIYLQWLAEL